MPPGWLLLVAHHADLTMVVAMTVVLVMQVSVDQIIDVIAMGNGWVPATWAMDMLRTVAHAVVAAGASSRICIGYLECMLLDLAVGTLVVQVSIVKVIDMSIVLDGRVATILAMDMIVVFVGVGHFSGFSSFFSSGTRRAIGLAPVS